MKRRLDTPKKPRAKQPKLADFWDEMATEDNRDPDKIEANGERRRIKDEDIADAESISDEDGEVADDEEKYKAAIKQFLEEGEDSADDNFDPAKKDKDEDGAEIDPEEEDAADDEISNPEEESINSDDRLVIQPPPDSLVYKSQGPKRMTTRSRANEEALAEKEAEEAQRVVPSVEFEDEVDSLTDPVPIVHPRKYGLITNGDVPKQKVEIIVRPECTITVTETDIEDPADQRPKMRACALLVFEGDYSTGQTQRCLLPYDPEQLSAYDALLHYLLNESDEYDCYERIAETYPLDDPAPVIQAICDKYYYPGSDHMLFAAELTYEEFKSLPGTDHALLVTCEASAGKAGIQSKHIFCNLAVQDPMTELYRYMTEESVERDLFCALYQCYCKYESDPAKLTTTFTEDLNGDRKGRAFFLYALLKPGHFAAIQ